MENRNAVPTVKGWTPKGWTAIGYSYLNVEDERSIILWVGKLEVSFAWKREENQARDVNSPR